MFSENENPYGVDYRSMKTNFILIVMIVIQTILSSGYIVWSVYQRRESQREIATGAVIFCSREVCSRYNAVDFTDPVLKEEIQDKTSEMSKRLVETLFRKRGIIWTNTQEQM